MTFNTIGRKYHQEEAIPLVIRRQWVDAHVSSRLRFVLVESDKVNSELSAGGEVFKLPGIFCIDQEESFEFVVDGNYVVSEVLFHPLFLNPAYAELETEITGLSSFLNKKKGQSGFYLILPMTAQRLKALINKMEDELMLQSDEFWPCRSRSYLMDCLMILERLYLGHIETQTKIVPKDWIDMVVNELSDNYQNPPTLVELSERYHINRTSLSDQFKVRTGQTISDFISTLRLRVAKDLLTGTALPISEIAFRVGFDDPSSFYRYFKKNMKTTPLLYRESNTWL